jgi:4-diphosphocytidyl-2-C-methyl-D-erythritol kinase
MIGMLAPAKINLFLHINGKRADGYHTLQSLIFFGDIGDRVMVEVATQNSLTASGVYAEFLPPPSDNLMMKALEALQQCEPRTPPLRIQLKKNLPIASGMGGGSADAAALLRAAQALSEHAVPEELLQKLLLSLGAEMPVCYASKPSLVQGMGDKVSHWPDLPEWGIVLVNPNVALPTQEAFAAMEPMEFLSAREFVIPRHAEEWEVLAMHTQNNMTAAAIRRVPAVASVLGVLDAIPECFVARMSGSGATCFGLFKHREMALAAAQALSAEYPEWWVKAGEISQKVNYLTNR